MVDHPGWYPPGQVCYPPELPTYLKGVHELKPIVGLPSDNEIIGIHSVIHVANRVSAAPEMHNPRLLMSLADHLFAVQMARYRSRYSLITFPSDATYTPPTLPAHVSGDLKSISGVPTDEEIIKVQEVVQNYQELRRFPTMFDPHVNMELSQHLFDLQMARHMRAASETQPSLQPQIISNMPGIAEQTLQATPDSTSTTNNIGTGAFSARAPQQPQLTAGIDARELMEQSNRLAERLGHLLERSNELAERSTSPVDQPNQLSERFHQVLERLSQIMEPKEHPAEQADRLTERLDQFFERFAQVLERSPQYANQRTETSNGPIEKMNELIERLAQHFESSNRLTVALGVPVAKIGETLKNINKVLVGIQHAIVRNNMNLDSSLDRMVNVKGETFIQRNIIGNLSPRTIVERWRNGNSRSDLSMLINGGWNHLDFPNDWLVELLRFFGISQGLCEEGRAELLAGKEDEAKRRLYRYLVTWIH